MIDAIASGLAHTAVISETGKVNSAEWHSLSSDCAVTLDSTFEGKSIVHEQQYLS
jgi:uncharacterized protein YjaZ